MTRTLRRPLRASRRALPLSRPVASAPSRFQSWLVGAMVWVQLFYLAIPADVFTPRTDEPLVLTANPVTRAIKLGLFVISLLLLLANSGDAARLLRRLNRGFVGLLLLAAASCAWSVSAGDTVARCLSVLSIVSVSTAFCVVGWHPQRFQAVVRPAVTALLAGSLLFGIMSPDLAIEQGDGSLQDAWRGLTYQKNYFGQLATFGLILWLHAALTAQTSRLRAFAGIALSVACALLARSSTSWMASAAAVALLVAMLRSAAGQGVYQRYIIAAMFGCVLLYGLAVLNLLPGSSLLLQPIATITGKDLSFTNRTEIWRIVEAHIWERPLFGSGYGAYWIGAVPESASFVFMALMNFYPTESHNGYLEIVNDLGFVGLALLIAMIVLALRQALQLAHRDRAQATLLLAILLQQCVVNLSESCWMVVTSGFIFGIVTLALFALARASADAPPPMRRHPLAARVRHSA